MKKNQSAHQWFGLVAAVSVLTFALSGCSGSDGSAGPPGPPGANVGVASPADATALTMTITGVTVASPPVVNFTVTNQSGVPVVGLADTDLRFNIAKLTPGTNGNPGTWQNYIVTGNNGAMQGSQERKTTAAGIKWGTLVDHKDGTYTYTFATDITSATANPCPAPCTDADGNPLDISYQPTLTTRVGIQQGNSAYPRSNATYDFVPAGGAVTTERIIVGTANCNQCHNQLRAHGSRIDTKLCVTCHNPGSWVAARSTPTPAYAKETVDFKVMIHKIHRGESLPSVLGPDGVLGTADDGKYTIRTDDFSDVVFPQDIRNCTKCHNNSDLVATPQGDNWETQPSMAACGSCHDNIDFSKAGPPAGTDPNGHPGGVVTDNSECLTCHAVNKVAHGIAEIHTDPVKAIAAKFKFNLISVTGGNTPVIQFSVTDPTNSDAPYDITTDPAFTQVASGVSRIALVVGWNQLNTADLANTGSGVNPAQPISVFPTAECGGPTNPPSVPDSADWTCSGPVAGVYTLTKLSALPASAAGTGRVGFEGHPAALDTAPTPAYTVRVPVTSVVKDWAISGTLTARRNVVDIAKCDQCHAQLSLHGNNRTDEPRLCVICHNPNDTDAARRPKTGGILSGGVDGKLEESIDFKRMIHGIHGAGMREKGLVVYGFGGSVNDFSDVRFPGILNDCSTCHTATSYQLTGIWETPTESGILGSTISTTPTATDATSYATQVATPDDDLNITPTAAVCSSCHDGALQAQHMIMNGAVFAATQTDITNHTVAGGFETCAICHGPGAVADVKVVHGSK
ncbi:MAG: OmcA/MtrC family decaheme c-type cytochrome [Bacteroidota bacterium]